MPNSTQYNLTVNADGVYSALERAQNSFDRFGVQATLAGQKTAATQSAIEEAIRNTGSTSVRSERDIRRFMDSLVQQSATAGMSRDQMLEWAAAQRGISDAAQPFINNIRATQAAMAQQAQMAREVAAAEKDLAAATQAGAVQRQAAANLAQAAAAAKGQEAEALRATSARAAAAADTADKQAEIARAQLAAQAEVAAHSKAQAQALADQRAAEAAKTAAAQAGAAERFRLWSRYAQLQAQASKSATDAQLAQQKMADAQAAAQAKITAQQIAAAQAQAAGGGFNSSGGISAAQQAAAMRMVPAQFTDIVVQLQGGANPLTVLLQQGGQLKDMFGSVAGAAKGMATYVMGLFTPITIGVAALVVGIGGAIVAMHQGAEEAKALNRAITMSGDYAGVTASNMRALAESLKDINGHGAAMSAVTAVLSTGKTGSAEAVEAASRALLAYERATGQAQDKAMAAFQPLFDDPQKGAERLQLSMHFLSAEQQAQIKTMQEAGDRSGALVVAFNALDTQSQKSIAQAGYLAKAWHGVSMAISSAWASIKEIGAADTPAQELAKAQANLAAAKRGGVSLFGGEDMYAGDVRSVQEAQKAVAAAQAKVDAERKAANEARTRAVIAESEKHTSELRDSMMSNAEKRAKAAKDASAKYERDVAELKRTGGASAENIAKLAAERDATIASAADKFKDPKQHKAAGARNDAAETMLRSAQETAATLQAQLNTREKLGAEAAKLLKFDTEIEAIQKKQARGQKLTDSEKSLLLHRMEVDAALQRNAQLEKQVEAQTQLNELKKRAASIDADILNYQQQQSEQYQSQLDAIGKGRKEQQIAASERSIRKKYLQEQAKLDRDTPESLRGSDEYLAAQQRIAAGREKSLADNRNYYAQMDAAQSDWRNGVTQGWADYADAAANNMALAQSAFTSTTNTLQQTFDTFVKTGKLNFSDMTKSILADLAKIAEQKAIVGLVNMGISAVSSFMGGGDIPAGTPSTTSGLNQYQFHLATGGAVSGPGTSTSDSIPAWLSDGEYVLKASAVDRIGVHTLDALNSGHSIHSVARFASGGAVGSVARATRPAGGNTTLVDVTVNTGGSSLDASDIPGLKADIQALIDARLAQKMKGQGGYAWQMANGSV
ncbi:phage tail tape measure protein [Burkholderia ubonensis]|uniref:phage tail tape measure protein n=1 Tax=Burkholderia ubonensis TaxID=101571 RepID=UPI000755C2BE|nr:phage tail tape measure protein [Burkholderia ubonensis]KVX73219.1 hypothetical protein WL08_01850 [Burkholderia ubonensis]